MKLLKTLTYLKNTYLWKRNILSVQQQYYSSNSSSYVDPYKILGLTRDATKAEVKNAYFKLAKLYHPDRNPSDTTAKEKFESVQNSYRFIMERIVTTSDEPEVNEATYDFTLHPLGVETHPVPTVFSSRGYKLFWIIFLSFVILLYLKPHRYLREIIEDVADYEEAPEDQVERLRRNLNTQDKASKKIDKTIASINEGLVGFLTK